MRIDKDNLNIAKAVAARSTCLRRQYGADDEITATGYNGEANCCDVCKEHSTPIDAARHGDQYGTCVAVHAEQNAIISATLACLDDSMIKNAGITRVVTRAGTF